MSKTKQNFRISCFIYKLVCVCVCVCVCARVRVCMCAQWLQSCPTLCDPMDCSPPGSSVHGILQARILDWVAMPSSRGSSPPRNRTCISCLSCIGKWIFITSATWEATHIFPNGLEGSTSN